MAQWLFPALNVGFKTTLKLFSDFEIEGQENIPKSGPLLVASNHISNLDPAIVAAALPRPPVFMAKKELFKYGIGSIFMRGYGAFPVDRHRADVRALNWITRNKEGILMKGQPGLAHIAMSTGVPIIPVALTGSENLQNPIKVFKPTATLRLKIGKSFTASSAEGSAARRKAAAVTTETMVRIARMLPEDKRGAYADKCGIELKETSDFTWSTSEVFA
jgi:1-acyl-sn-glycerol-3-phosphate acyltransferase